RPPYPSKEELRAEAEEEAPAMLLTVADADGKVIRTVTGPVRKGFECVGWDLRYPASSLPRPRPTGAADDIFTEEPAGPLVMPGTYRVTLAKRQGGEMTKLAGPLSFNVVMDGIEKVDAADRKSLFEFQMKVHRLERAVSGALEAANDLSGRLERIRQALDRTPGIYDKWKEAGRGLEERDRRLGGAA